MATTTFWAVEVQKDIFTGKGVHHVVRRENLGGYLSYIGFASKAGATKLANRYKGYNREWCKGAHVVKVEAVPHFAGIDIGRLKGVTMWDVVSIEEVGA